MSNFAQYLGIVLLHDAEALEDEAYSGSFASLAERLTERLNDLEISLSDIGDAITILSEFGGAKFYPDPLTGGYYQINYDNFRYYFIQSSPDFNDEDKDGYARLREALISDFPILVTYSENGAAFAKVVISHLQKSTPDQIAELKADNGTRVVRASDRVVSFDHNSREAEDVIEFTEAASEAIRGSNSLEEEQRGWIREHLSAGVEFIRKHKKMLAGAAEALLLKPLRAAYEAVAEEPAKAAILAAIKAIKTMFGL